MTETRWFYVFAIVAVLIALSWPWTAGAYLANAIGGALLFLAVALAFVAHASALVGEDSDDMDGRR